MPGPTHQGGKRSSPALAGEKASAEMGDTLAFWDMAKQSPWD